MKANGDELPDARLLLWGRRDRTDINILGQRYELVFCVNCGAPGGAVTKGCPIFYLCDECVFKHGPPPGCIEFLE